MSVQKERAMKLIQRIDAIECELRGLETRLTRIRHEIATEHGVSDDPKHESYERLLTAARRW